MPYTLPALPYAYNALEPHIDARTMEIHHTKHHQAYINNVNNALGRTPIREQVRRRTDRGPEQSSGEHPHASFATTAAAMPITRCSGRSWPRQAAASRPATWPRRSTARSAASTSSRKQFAQGRDDPLRQRLGLADVRQTASWLIESTAESGQPVSWKAARRSSAWTCGNTPTTSTTRTAAPTTSPRSGTW